MVSTNWKLNGSFSTCRMFSLTTSTIFSSKVSALYLREEPQVFQDSPNTKVHHLGCRFQSSTTQSLAETSKDNKSFFDRTDSNMSNTFWANDANVWFPWKSKSTIFESSGISGDYVVGFNGRLDFQGFLLRKHFFTFPCKAAWFIKVQVGVKFGRWRIGGQKCVLVLDLYAEWFMGLVHLPSWMVDY